MMHYGHWMGSGGNLLMIVAVVLPVLAITVGWIAVQIQRQPGEPPPTEPIPEAERVLAERFARGELEVDEYERRLHTLRGARS
jgi:putative membrane protein